MSQSLNISVFQVVGSQLCVSSDDGQKVHDLIALALAEGRRVTVSFLNVIGLTSAFLNAAIGQLYGSFTEEQIRSSLTVKDMQPDDLALLKRVVETARQYFKDPERFQLAMQEA